MVSLNDDDGMHVIGHYYESVDDHVRIVVRNSFHFRFRNDSRD